MPQISNLPGKYAMYGNVRAALGVRHEYDVCLLAPRTLSSAILVEFAQEMLG